MNRLLKAIAAIFILVVILAAGSVLYAAASQSGSGSMMPGGMMQGGMMPGCMMDMRMMMNDAKTRGQMMQIQGRMMQEMGELIEKRGKELEQAK